MLNILRNKLTIDKVFHCDCVVAIFLVVDKGLEKKLGCNL